MQNEIRLSGPTLKVLRMMVDDIGRRWSGAEISKVGKIGAGTLYPLLARLESHGWLGSEWEVGDPSELGRPRRRFYRLTALGQRSALQALSEFQVIGDVAWTS